jgi:hypothetical protein
MKDKDKRFTPIMLYTCTTLFLLVALGSWYFILNPSGFKYSTDNVRLTTTIFDFLTAIGFTILCLYFIKISEIKLSKVFWFLLMLLEIIHATSKYSPIKTSEFSFRLIRASINTSEFLLFSTYLYLYKKCDINLFGKFDVLKKEKHNHTLI